MATFSLRNMTHCHPISISLKRKTHRNDNVVTIGRQIEHLTIFAENPRILPEKYHNVAFGQMRSLALIEAIAGFTVALARVELQAQPGT
jgi:hypothetical protein